MFAFAFLETWRTWPYGWMFWSFVTAALAIPLPWLNYNARFWLSLGAALAAAGTTTGYLLVLHYGAPPGTAVLAFDVPFLFGLLSLGLISSLLGGLTSKQADWAILKLKRLTKRSSS